MDIFFSPTIKTFDHPVYDLWVKDCENNIKNEIFRYYKTENLGSR